MGCETVVHAIQEYTDTHIGIPDHVFVKMDLTKPSIRFTGRRSFAKSPSASRAPAPLVYQAYCQPSPLHLGSTRLWSISGVQQGDSAGPILFALAIDLVKQILRSLLNLRLLVNCTLAKPKETVAATLSSLSPTPELRRRKPTRRHHGLPLWARQDVCVGRYLHQHIPQHQHH